MQTPLLALLRTYYPSVSQAWVIEAALGRANDAVIADLGGKPQRSSSREGREPGVTQGLQSCTGLPGFIPVPLLIGSVALGHLTSLVWSRSFLIYTMG